MNLTSNVTIGFGDGGTSADGTLSIALDSDYIKEVYNQAKTTFAPNETSYFRVEHKEGTYDINSSIGSVSVVATNILGTETETIIFANVSTGSLSRTPVGLVTWRWLGNDGGEPQFDGRNITINNGPIVGVLYCEYQAAGDRIALDVTTEDYGGELVDITAVVVAIQDSNTASASATYSLDSTAGGGDTAPVDTNIEVRSYCDDSLVVGASVSINGEPKGETNEHGLCYVGKLNPGQEYNLLVTKPDEYISSNQDTLANDKFVISV